MNVRVLLVAVVAVVLGILASPTPGHAETEKAKTNQSAKLYRRAGEQSPVILDLKSGQIVTVIARDGRWLRVRVAGRTGWLPRSKVDLADEDGDIVRNTRRQPFVGGRGTRRGFGGETGPDDRVGADAVGEGDDEPASVSTGKREDTSERRQPPPSEPDPAEPGDAEPGDSEPDQGDADAAAGGDAAAKQPRSTSEPTRPIAHVAKSTKVLDRPDTGGKEVFTADQKMALYVGRSQGKWTRVSSDEGDAGWVLTSQLDLEEADQPAQKRGLAIHARGRFGFMFVNQSVATPGGMANAPPDNYSAGSPAVTVALGGSALYPLGRRIWVGGELAYDLSRAFLGGLTYQGQTTSFTYHNLNLRAVLGYDLQSQRGTTVFARLGYHFDSFQVANVADFTKNTARIPNQIIQAPTLGLALAIPRLTQKLGAMISADAMVMGSDVAQTKNLEDGTNPGARGAFVGVGLSYRWKPSMDIQVNYEVSYISVSFGGMAPSTSLRGHTGTGPSSGADLNNALSAGVAYAF